MNENRMDSIAQVVERDISSYLDSKGRISAAKLSGRFFLNNADAYAAKASLEWSLDLMAKDPEYGGSDDQPLDYLTLDKSHKARLAEVRRQKNGIGVKLESQTS